MLTLPVVCAALFGFTQNALSRPMTRSIEKISLTSRSIEKRAPSGPQIGGANFPDPAIIGADSRWYAFATRTRGGNVHIQVAESTDYKSWSLVNNGDGSQKDALPELPSWVDGGNSNTWAPDVIRLDDGTYVMYYSATTKENTAIHCVGAAKADTVTGPYKPVSDQPLICPIEDGGAIDAAAYNDNGNRYIVWKVDGNAIGNGGACGNTEEPIVSTPIRVQQLAKDGVTLLGSPTTILDNEGKSDQGVIEAPDLHRQGNTWYLFFSANCYVTENYNVHYATASSVTGPFTRAERPLFQTGDSGLVAPGGADLDHDGRHMLFHAREGSDGDRGMYTALLKFDGNIVSA
ncbi:hypothetical protein Q7P37_005086 [Cladosporium fusiforme]